MAGAAQPSIDALQPIQGMPLLVNGSASSAQSLIDTFQNMPEMPLMAADTSELGASANIEESTRNHQSLWEFLAPPTDSTWNGLQDQGG